MTRLETIARPIYEKRMSQVGIPGFVIIPFDKLPRHARTAADGQAERLLGAWPDIKPETIKMLAPESFAKLLLITPLHQLLQAHALSEELRLPSSPQIMGRRG